MQDQSWFVYQNQQQIGPFTLEQIHQMYASQMLSAQAYVFCTGWKDWRLLADAYQEIGIPKPEGVEAASEAAHTASAQLGRTHSSEPQRRTGAPRASIEGRVIVHNDGQLVIGSGVNISMTGLFVETEERIFTVGERLKLTVKCDEMSKPFNVVAHVIRYNSDERWPIGYGLKFEGLEPLIREEIRETVDRQNRQHSDEVAQKAQ